MRGFQQSHDELASLGARVAGVSGDTFAALGAFAEQNGFEFDLLSDWPAYQTMEAFGVRREGGSVANRVTFVFDADGVLRNVIDEPRDMDIHAREALEAVKAISGAS